MNSEKILFNPKMREDGKPVNPYIKDEERTGNPYLIDIDQNEAPLFTDKNIDFINGMVANDSNYNQTDEYEICAIFNAMLDGDAEERKACVGRAVYEVDNQNSTHLTAIGQLKINKLMDDLNYDLVNNPWPVQPMPDDREVKTITGGALLTAEAIFGISDLRIRLGSGDESLVRDIAHAVEDRLFADGIKINKTNFSFATKFCHWASIFSKMGDNFCIYDKVVAEVLPYFAKYYVEDKSHIDDEPLRRGWYRIKNGKYGREIVSTVDSIKQAEDGYSQYKKLYDSVLVGVNEWRSKNGQNGDIGYREVDRLLWYYFKGARGKRTKRALSAIEAID